MRTRKIAYIIAAMCLLVLSLSACTFKSKDPVIASLGKAMSVQRYSCAGFGDSTDYGIYTFPGAKPWGERIFQACDRREQDGTSRIYR